jgi:ribosomal protein L12E/L44/L45/RPP1/RPP2
MTIKTVRDAIRDIAAILVAAGVKTQSKDLASLDAALEGSDHKSVSEFFAELQQRLAQSKAASRRSPETADKSQTSKRSTSATADQSTVDGYLQRLQAAANDEADFHVVFSELKKSKAVRKPEADAIAAAYTNGRTKWPSKAAAFGAIDGAFRERAYQAVKLQQVDKASRF